jgi:hypothetical protein
MNDAVSDAFQRFGPGIIGGLAGIGFLVWMLQWVRCEPRQENNNSILEYCKAFKILAIVFWLILIAAAIAALYAPASQKLAAYGVVGAFSIAIAAIHLETFGVAIRFNDEGLYLSSPWRRNRMIPWNAILNVRYSHSMQWFVCNTDGYGKIRLSIFLSGLLALLDEFEHRDVSTPDRAKLAELSPYFTRLQSTSSKPVR